MFRDMLGILFKYWKYDISGFLALQFSFDQAGPSSRNRLAGPSVEFGRDRGIFKNGSRLLQVVVKFSIRLNI